jgi:putative transposase
MSKGYKENTSTGIERVFAGLSADERALAMERYRILRAHLDQGVPLTQLSTQHQITRQTLQRWLNAYRAHGLVGLINKPRADRGQHRLSPPVLDLVRTAAFQSPDASIAAIHRAVTEAAHQHRLPVPSYASVQSVLRDFAVARNIVALDRIVSAEGITTLSTAAQTPNALWIADHRTLAVRVPDDSGHFVHPTLTILIDAYTCAIVGFALSNDPPSSQTTALAIRHAIWPKPAPDWPMCGIPQAIAVDYAAQDIHTHLAQFCADRSITVHSALPFASQGAGKGEFFVRLLTEHWLTAHTAKTPEPVLDQETLATAITQCCTWYHYTRHPATGQFPATHWQQELPSPVLPNAIEDLDVLLPVTLRRVHQDGIYLHGQQYFTPLLADYLSCTVSVRWHPNDLKTVRVYAEGRFVGVATLWEDRLNADTLPALDSYRQRLHRHAQALRASLPASIKAERIHSRERFVPTDAFQQFIDLCDRCRDTQSMALCCGPAGVGKTFAARTYQARSCHPRDDNSGRTSSVVYLQKEDGFKRRVQKLDYLLSQALSPSIRLVLIDNGEHLTEQDLRYLAELWHQRTWGMVVIGLPKLLMHSMEQLAFAKHITTCHPYQPLTDAESEHWVRNWYKHLPVGRSAHSKADDELSSDVIATIVMTTQGLPLMLSRLLELLERDLRNSTRLTLSRETITRAIDRLEAPGEQWNSQ